MESDAVAEVTEEYASVRPVYFSGASPANASSTAMLTSATCLMTDTGEFIANGRVRVPAHGYTLGVPYYLSDTAGDVTTSPNASRVIQRLFTPISDDSLDVDVGVAAYERLSVSFYLNSNVSVASSTSFVTLGASKWTKYSHGTITDIVSTSSGAFEGFKARESWLAQFYCIFDSSDGTSQGNWRFAFDVDRGVSHPIATVNRTGSNRGHTPMGSFPFYPMGDTKKLEIQVQALGTGFRIRTGSRLVLTRTGGP